MSSYHPAVQKEIDDLRERYPGKKVLGYDEFADRLGIERVNAALEFRRIIEKGPDIVHKRIGRDLEIRIEDFAYWLALHIIVDGKPIVIPPPTSKDGSIRRKRGYTF